MRKKIKSGLVITTAFCLCFPNFMVQAQENSPDAVNQVSYTCEKTDIEYEQAFSEYQANVTSSAEEKVNTAYDLPHIQSAQQGECNDVEKIYLQKT